MACRWLPLELMTVIGGHNVCYSPIKIHTFGDSAIEYRRKGTEVSAKRQWSIAEKPLEYRRKATGISPKSHWNIAEKPSFSYVKKWQNEVVLIQAPDNQLSIKLA